MNITKAVAIAVATYTLCSHQALAQNGKFGIAVKGGITQESIPDPTIAGLDASSKGEAAAGVSLSYNLNRNSSIELELVKGSVELSLSSSSGSVSSTIDINSTALYWSQRTDGDLFFKYKVGLLKEKLSADEVPDSSDTGLSFGIGGGYRLSSNSSLELEYIVVEQDISWILLSARFVPDF